MQLQLNGVSSCGNRLLLETQLREAWQSDAIVQTDCCDSVQTMVGAISPRTGKPMVNFTEAFGTAVNAGLGTYYGMSVCLSVCLSACLPACLSACLSLARALSAARSCHRRPG